MFLAVLLQTLVIAVALTGCWVLMGVVDTQALAYGSMVALVNSGMLVGRWYIGLNDYHCNGGRHLKSFHRSSLERFFVVGILLAVGFGLLSLAPQILLAGFIVGQLAWALANLLARRRL
jgi:ATP synthase protein I